jgi:plasmid stability protein
MPAVRVKEDLHQQLGVVAASEGRSVANFVDWTLRPILAAALGDESANGAVEQESGNGATNTGERASSPARSRRSAPARPSRDPAFVRQAKLNKAKGL